jgi:undecaprenyl-diphosphatase
MNTFFSVMDALTEPIPDGTGIPDVPDVSAEWYRQIVGSAAGSPEAIRVFVDLATDAVAVVLAAIFVAAWWRARTGPPLLVARVLLVPAAAVVAYPPSLSPGWVRASDSSPSGRHCSPRPHASSSACITRTM